MTSAHDGLVPIPDNELLEHSSRLKGKVVLITGAGNGIGKETAILLASFGAKIVIGDINDICGRKTASIIIAFGGQAISQKCDVAVWDNLVDLFNLAIANFGSVDIVIPNAGTSEASPFYNVILDETGRPQEPALLPAMQVNLTGVLYTVHLAQHYLHVGQDLNAPSLKSVVLIGSMSSWAGFSPAPVYSATKHGVLGLMRSVDSNFERKGVRVACVTPFFAKTDLLPLYMKLALAGIPFTPVARIAGAVVYAVSHPDPATSGCGYVLPDNGPVIKVSREEFKPGVLKKLDDGANPLLKYVGLLLSCLRLLRDFFIWVHCRLTGIFYVGKIMTDIVQLLGKPTLLLVMISAAGIYFLK
ncbi:NAD(P)-binding protein [Gymnopus androsaceus JB14]|uniref:NAD(P)-binding protein n=1 Tax=Gymnopus androsaceus JB14 TaxID=1447944 RepID=A0A6A4H2L9_9AGAR|nr:NAD(P)-binding protein [Gymnopus androsaceus JB14]